MNDLRERLTGAGAVRLGAIATLVWVALVALSWFLGAGDTRQDLAERLLHWAGIVTPVALIWLAVWTAGALDALRHEAQSLRDTLDAMGQPRHDPRGRGPGSLAPGDSATRPVVPAHTPVEPQPRAEQLRPPAQPRPARAAEPRPAPQGDTRQGDLALDPPPPEVSAHELVAALNFPDGPDDRYTIAALRKALADPEIARLIRAAQDVITLMAARGIYMDDAPPRYPDAALWRRFADGARGTAVQALSLDADANALTLAAEMLHGDEVFRDAAHHFQRHFDRLILRAAQEFDDELLAALSDTRSGRAFTMLAQVKGTIGQGVEAESQP